MGMLNGVHGHTTDFRPAVPLCLVFVVSTSSLQHRLVDTASTSNDANHSPVGRGDDLLGTGGQLDTNLPGLGVVRNNCGIVSRGLGQTATVASLLLQGAQDVTDLKIGLLATVDELAGVHALGGNEGLTLQLVAVGIPERDPGKGSTATGVVDDVLDNTLDVAMPLSVVHSPQPSGTLPVLGVRLEDASSALTLAPDYTTHRLACWPMLWKSPM